MERVKLQFDEASEDRSVVLTLSPELAEVLENMFFVAFGIADMYAAKRLGKPYSPNSREAAQGSTTRLLTAPRATLDEMGEVIREMHCIVHHPGKTCEDMLGEHGEPSEPWRDA